MITEYKKCTILYSLPKYGELPIMILPSKELLETKKVKKSYIFRVHSTKDDPDYQARLFIEELIQLAR